MNSLKKAEGVSLLSFEGGPGVPLLNFRGVPGLTFKLWREFRGPGTRGPAPIFTPCRLFDQFGRLKLHHIFVYVFLLVVSLKLECSKILGPSWYLYVSPHIHNLPQTNAFTYNPMCNIFSSTMQCSSVKNSKMSLEKPRRSVKVNKHDQTHLYSLVRWKNSSFTIVILKVLWTS